MWTRVPRLLALLLVLIGLMLTAGLAACGSEPTPTPQTTAATTPTASPPPLSSSTKTTAATTTPSSPSTSPPPSSTKPAAPTATASPTPTQTVRPALGISFGERFHDTHTSKLQLKCDFCHSKSVDTFSDPLAQTFNAVDKRACLSCHKEGGVQPFYGEDWTKANTGG